MKTKLIKTGQIETGTNDDVLESLGVGSCVVLCLYDRKNKVGGLAHIMLPAKNPKFTEENSKSVPAEYAEIGVKNLISEINKLGGDVTSLEAKIFGGAEMFKYIKEEPVSLGAMNLAAVKQELENASIDVSAKDIGGSSGRSIRFYINNGDVEVRKRL